MIWLKSYAAVDDFYTQIEDWIDEGYNYAIWKCSPSPCPICRKLDGKKMDLQIMLTEMEYDAAIYSQTHVGCKCRLINPTKN